MSDENARQRRSVPGGRHTSHVTESLPEKKRKIAVYELQRERSDVFVSLIDATQHEAKRQILTALYINDGVAMYDELDNAVNRHLRKIKKHVYALEDSGIVEKGGNPAVVSFVDTDIALLAEDTLHITDPL